MIKIAKIITYLYVGISAATAETIVFDGNEDYGIIKFKMPNYIDEVGIIKKLA